jgi:heptosyltransferase III
MNADRQAASHRPAFGISVYSRTPTDRSAPNRERLDGKLSWPQLAALLSRANVYVGPDTSVTHLAAASGCPTVALYGPTDPRLWGPWPVDGLQPNWEAAGALQRRGNVWLVRHPLPCQPCQEEGCNRHIASFSYCLDRLAADRVLVGVEEALSATQSA